MVLYGTATPERSFCVQKLVASIETGIPDSLTVMQLRGGLGYRIRAPMVLSASTKIAGDASRSLDDSVTMRAARAWHPPT